VDVIEGPMSLLDEFNLERIAIDLKYRADKCKRKLSKVRFACGVTKPVSTARRGVIVWGPIRRDFLQDPEARWS
jgi:hypothetical protein